MCFVLVRPLSKSTYRRINRVVAELLWLELIWLVDWWAGVKVLALSSKSLLTRLVNLSLLTSKDDGVVDT